jgi:hypothetical protein
MCYEHPCADGSLCAAIAENASVGMCMFPCLDDTHCSNISSGDEACDIEDRSTGLTYCVVLCTSDLDCTCGMGCLPTPWGVNMCQP